MPARDLYVIAHRCNNPAKAAAALEAGANAIECDVMLIGGALMVCHPPDPAHVPEPPFPLQPYLAGLRSLADRHRGFALLIFDCKTAVASAAVALLAEVRRWLGGTGLSILVSVGSADSSGFFAQIASTLGPREAIAVDGDTRTSLVSTRLRAMGASNFGYGNGLAVLEVSSNVRPTVSDAVLNRDRYGFRFVYVWTVTDDTRLADYLRLGVDGIMVNDPALAHAVLGRAEFASTVRLGRRDVSAFASSRNPAYELVVATGDRWGAGTDADVYVTLHGDRGATAEHLLDVPLRNDFEVGDRSVFVLTDSEIGELRRVRVRHDNGGVAPGWFLDFVSVRRGNTLWRCDCNRWLARDEDDGAIDRTLTARRVTAAPAGPGPGPSPRPPGQPKTDAPTWWNPDFPPKWQPGLPGGDPPVPVT